MKKIILLSSVFALAFVGCKKSSSESSCTLSSSSIVGTYKVTSMIITSPNQSIEVFNDDNFTPPCTRDNIYTFNANGTYAITDGVDICNPSDAYQTTWSLSGDKLTMNGTDGPTISEFTCTSFKLKETVGTSGIYNTYTYTRQ